MLMPAKPLQRTIRSVQKESPVLSADRARLPEDGPHYTARVRNR
jgi:hypothetical protein